MKKYQYNNNEKIRERLINENKLKKKIKLAA